MTLIYAFNYKLSTLYAQNLVFQFLFSKLLPLNQIPFQKEMQIVFHTTDSSLRRAVEGFVEEWKNVASTIDVQTSGSTGRPKTIRLRKEHMEASARMTGNYLELKEGATALLCMSPETIAGKMMIVRSLVLGMELHVVDVCSTPLTEIAIPIDFAAMVPLQVEGSLKETPTTFRNIKKLIVGGGTVSETLKEKIVASGIGTWQTFGMTETISHVAMKKVSANRSYYRTLPGVEVSSHEGCLVISAPHLGVENLETNDRIRLIDTSTFEWLGRKDFVINSGGIKIHPEQIEQRLEQLIRSPFFSVGIPDEQLGERHVICIEQKRQSLAKSDFISTLEDYTTPKEIYYFDSFAYTKSGKINRLETIKNITNAEKQVL